MKNNKEKKFYKRRDILIGASTVTAIGVLAACKDQEIKGGTPEKPEKASNISKNIIQWRMATTWPKNFPGVGTTAENVAKYTKAKL